MRVEGILNYIYCTAPPQEDPSRARSLSTGATAKAPATALMQPRFDYFLTLVNRP